MNKRAPHTRLASASASLHEKGKKRANSGTELHRSTHSLLKRLWALRLDSHIKLVLAPTVWSLPRGIDQARRAQSTAKPPAYASVPAIAEAFLKLGAKTVVVGEGPGH